MSRLLYPRSSVPHFPLNRKMYRPKGSSGFCGDYKNLLHLPGIEPWLVTRSAVNLDMKTTADMERPVLGFLSEVKTRIMHTARPLTQHSTVSFWNGSFYDDSLLRPLSSRIEHSRIVVHHCRNSSVLSVLSALLALFRCAPVSSFSILVKFFLVDCDFSAQWLPSKKTEKKKKSKRLALHSISVSSEPRPGPSSAK